MALAQAMYKRVGRARQSRRCPWPRAKRLRQSGLRERLVTPGRRAWNASVVTLENGPPLDVTVVDREQQAQGFFYRAWRNL
ncbi:hypothetical protein AB0E25_40775, partial [Streptomyces bobili]|uniref:hypothetical protein n=1 Tax=Streptomyces bobili TaxID=67280 RepID=UPI0033F6FD63